MRPPASPAASGRAPRLLSSAAALAALAALVVGPAAPAPVRGEQRVTLCHCPSGNPDRCREITVAASAVAAHLAHGDTLGTCDGYCVPGPPEDEGYKDKQGRAEKLAELLATTETPSALAGAFFRLALAYESGRAPESDLEAFAFNVFSDLSGAGQNVLQCATSRVSTLTEAERLQLFGPVIAVPDSAPLTRSDLALLVADELEQRLSLAAFGEDDPALCLADERPGLPRPTLCFDVDGSFEGFCPNICRVRTSSLTQAIRTVGFVPGLSAGELLLPEIEQACTIDADGFPNCDPVSPPDCTGNAVDGVCLRVPAVENGDTVILEGFNFFDVDAMVTLESLPPLGVFRQVEAHVCGDVDTPADAPVDCDVHDIITFGIPDDLPEGLYRVGVTVPNNTGDPVHDHASYSDSPLARPVIRVIPPQTTSFQITVEELHVVDETGSFDFTGSDELGMKILSVPIGRDGSLGMMRTVDIDIGDLDTGNRRSLQRVLFSGVVDAGVTLSMVGFEVDSRDAYEQQVREFAEAYGLILQSNWNQIATTLGSILGAGLQAAGYGQYSAVASQALSFGINVFAALWAPADLIIEDSAGIPFVHLAELTSLNFPNPPLVEYTSAGGIDVKVEPCQDTMDEDYEECPDSAKAPFQYTERRQYDSDKEGSKYKLTFQYTRVQ